MSNTTLIDSMICAATALTMPIAYDDNSLLPWCPGYEGQTLFVSWPDKFVLSTRRTIVCTCEEFPHMHLHTDETALTLSAQDAREWCDDRGMGRLFEAAINMMIAHEQHQRCHTARAVRESRQCEACAG